MSDINFYIIKKLKEKKELEGIDNRIIEKYITSLRSELSQEFKKVIERLKELEIRGDCHLIERNSSFKRIVKELKRIFHNNYYLFIKEYSKREALLDRFRESGDVSCLREVALTHVSVKERYDYYKVLNEWISKKVGYSRIVLDIGCGFNPIFIDVNCDIYYGVDLNGDDLRVNETYFRALNKEFLWKTLDVIKNPDPLLKEQIFGRFESKLCLMFKVVDIFENIRKNSSLELIKALINNLGFRKFIVSFPTKSICGKEMCSKRSWFLNFINKNTDYDFKVEKFEIPNEVFYYIRVL